jgi:DNA-nicking Smr family endonuclease
MIWRWLLGHHASRRPKQAYGPPTPDDGDETDEPAELPIDGVLDLHLFRPKEVPDLVREYIRECHKRGIFEVRVIHGKGKGTLRRTVHAVLDKMPEVSTYGLADPHAGGWGATLVTLAPSRSADDDPT